MNLNIFSQFKEIWLVDFEFNASGGENPDVVCLVAYEVRSKSLIRLWQEELKEMQAPPYMIGKEALFIAYYASAELSCHLALGWDLPEYILDLFVEFRTATNGKDLLIGGSSLVMAMTHFGLDFLSVVEKDQMRDLVLRGGPWNAEERSAIMNYCEADVRALQRLLPAMLPAIDLPRAILRGRSMKANAKIENAGVPIDLNAFLAVKDKWEIIKSEIIRKIDGGYGIFEGQSFREARFEQFLIRESIAWPRLESGRLSLDDETFREMARVYPQVAPIRELRSSLSKLRLSDLTVGLDGRNRCLLSAFRARTGRNQPSNSKFIFGPHVWIRGFIRPSPGFGLAYIDWEQQEFGIAAALSGDSKMVEAYQSGDPYLAFAKQAEALPPEATKKTHGNVREQFKACVLAVQYGMGAGSLANRIGRSVAHARDLLRMHRETYRRFWEWSDGAVDYGMLRGVLYTVFGWAIHIGSNVNPRSLRNFPMQANGAEMLRLACCYITESGITVCAPVHDAILIEAQTENLTTTIEQTQKLMGDASQMVLDGFRLRTDVKVISYPERYEDPRGKKMWETVWETIGAVSKDGHPCNIDVCANAT